MPRVVLTLGDNSGQKVDSCISSSQFSCGSRWPLHNNKCTPAMSGQGARVVVLGELMDFRGNFPSGNDILAAI